MRIETIFSLMRDHLHAKLMAAKLWHSNYGIACIIAELSFMQSPPPILTLMYKHPPPLDMAYQQIDCYRKAQHNKLPSERCNQKYRLLHVHSALSTYSPINFSLFKSTSSEAASSIDDGIGNRHIFVMGRLYIS